MGEKIVPCAIGLTICCFIALVTALIVFHMPVYGMCEIELRSIGCDEVRCDYRYKRGGRGSSTMEFDECALVKGGGNPRFTNVLFDTGGGSAREQCQMAFEGILAESPDDMPSYCGDGQSSSG